jgi:hypothetical protein
VSADGLRVERHGSSVSVWAGERRYSGLGLGPDGFVTRPPAGFEGRVVLRVDYVFVDDAEACEFIEAHGDGRVLAAEDGGDADITLEADYRDLLDWLHGPLLVGNLVMDGARMGGELAAFSTLEGIVSSERVDAAVNDAPVVEQLRGLAGTAAG